MTREEAIGFGKMWLDINSDAKDSLTYKFFERALEVLKAEPCEDCRKAEEIMQTLCDYGCEMKIQDAISQVLETECTKCGDAVKRESVLNTLDTMDKALDENRTVEHYKELLKECYKTLPPVTPKQRTGKWVTGQTIGDGFTCSECNTHYHMYPMFYRFCPNCGARMER